jgi:hypothetical protein
MHHLLWYHVIMTWSCICEYKMDFSCICNYDLWLMLIWTNMKSVAISSNNIWKFNCFAISNVVHRWSDTMSHLIQFELWLQIIVANVHVYKCEKNMFWLMKLLNLVIWIFFLVILIEKIVKSIIKFSAFVKFSKEKVKRNHNFQFLTY